MAPGGPTIPWETLRTYRRNALKTRTPDQITRLAGAILDRTGRGFAFPVFVWDGHDLVIDGAGRAPALELLEKAGHVVPEHLPVALIQARDEHEAAELVLLASAHHGDTTEESLLAYAATEKLRLSKLAAMLRFQGLEVEKVAKRQAAALAGLGPLGSGPGAGGGVDDIPDVPKKVTTQPGDLWLMGDHRLLCGDSTKPEDVERVMGGERADICITDPPYGVGLSYESTTDTEADLVKLISKWLPVARQVAPVLVFTPGVERAWLYPRPTWAFAWFYGGGQMRSCWGFSCWQPVLCYGPDPSLASGNGCRPDAVNLNTPANLPDIDHPCPKPVAFWDWVFKRTIFKPRAIIFDPFGGSGTSAIVAEMLGHVARLVEISPAYCDVIVRRWEKYTGERATREGRDGAGLLG